MAELIATCVWSASPDLLVAVHDHLGPPAHAYDNGSQAWLRDDGPDGVPVEWRLHPRPDLARPGRLSGYHLFPAVAGALARGEDPALDPTTVWCGLEAVPAFDDDVEPDTLAAHLGTILGWDPDAWGPLDRDELARRWERSHGDLDVVAWAVAHLRAA
ncbi:hypothetical protein PO878_03635 [Iamia majanohamensis]|uniref:Uncharacterized protein n=1 Tax=Iamia majanohamensis TaxID=467976 RepID=A0AAE9YB77_9ACTN|nr:hypothetical protein [Iamia majanohamensis]WCO67814.1 hypothetical protein PO878_03635 [Iamia majanohamensis]